MGMFEVKVKLANLAAPGRTEEVSLLVDTGATLLWIPREVVQKLGVKTYSRLPFTLADGHRLDRDATAVLMTIDGGKGAVQVAFGEAGEEAVLGATSLEGLGFLVDPAAQRLVPRDLRQLRAVRSHNPTRYFARNLGKGTIRWTSAYPLAGERRALFEATFEGKG